MLKWLAASPPATAGPGCHWRVEMDEGIDVAEPLAQRAPRRRRSANWLEMTRSIPGHLEYPRRVQKLKRWNGKPFMLPRYP